MDEAEVARARELRGLLDRLRVTPDGWPAMDAAERLRWLVENTAQVLHPRPPFMRFRSSPAGGLPLQGPFLLEGPEGEQVEAERADLFERLRHEAAGEVARQLLAADPLLGEEVRREAGALLVLLDQAAEARGAGRPRTEPVAHVERLLGSLAARLLRPDADRARRARTLLAEGRAAENRRRAGEAARRHAAAVEAIARRLRERPEASDSAIAGWVRRGGGTTLGLSSLRQLVGRVRRGGAAGES